MYNAMKRLIERKFYKTGEEAQIKIDVFFAVCRIEQEQYEVLTELVAQVYGDEGNE
jgi:hypothetical protein